MDGILKFPAVQTAEVFGVCMFVVSRARAMEFGEVECNTTVTPRRYCLLVSLAFMSTRTPLHEGGEKILVPKSNARREKDVCGVAVVPMTSSYPCRQILMF